MSAGGVSGTGRERGSDRLPRLTSPAFWGLAALLAVALYILGIQIDQLWPGLPGWGRTLAAFLLTGTVGEFYVHHRWPALRMVPAESREISLGYLAIACVIAVLVAIANLSWGIALPPSPLAWVSYLTLIILDSSSRW